MESVSNFEVNLTPLQNHRRECYCCLSKGRLLLVLTGLVHPTLIKKDDLTNGMVDSQHACCSRVLACNSHREVWRLVSDSSGTVKGFALSSSSPVSLSTRLYWEILAGDEYHQFPELKTTGPSRWSPCGTQWFCQECRSQCGSAQQFSRNPKPETGRRPTTLASFKEDDHRLELGCPPLRVAAIWRDIVHCRLESATALHPEHSPSVNSMHSDWPQLPLQTMCNQFRRILQPIRTFIRHCGGTTVLSPADSMLGKGFNLFANLFDFSARDTRRQALGFSGNSAPNHMGMSTVQYEPADRQAARHAMSSICKPERESPTGISRRG
ncbi:hypothetical protein RRG08_043499 [Elysia crispata]|uniref:Uncharacterized protein n=1 Tax=Elysia crispata TaxID=231223 RepID=A0AAE0YF91_9GAST|nr:hypothetical protein RRG08_043499 [Elysia crispata]